MQSFPMYGEFLQAGTIFPLKRTRPWPLSLHPRTRYTTVCLEDESSCPAPSLLLALAASSGLVRLRRVVNVGLLTN